MILSNFVIPSKINYQTNFEKPDSPNDCLNIDHFNNYPYNITYKYNSRGFRDIEWPENLKDAIWCIGDSFTVGLGSPIEHTWPYLLSKATELNTINISVNGASNAWISRKALELVATVKPKKIVIMWSYFYRRESDDTSLSDEERQIWSNNNKWQINYKDFKDNRDKVKNTNTHMIDCCIPDCWRGSKLFLGIDILPTLIKDKNFLGEVQLLDYARDYHHFDIKTSKYLVNKIIEKL
jgi:hypothetical protein